MFHCPDHGPVEIGEVMACPECNKNVFVVADGMTVDALFRAVTEDLQAKKLVRKDEEICAIMPVQATPGKHLLLTFKVSTRKINS